MRKIIILYCCYIISINISAQENHPESRNTIYNQKDLSEKFESYAFSIPIEKVYLHIDKPFYYAGEDLWFKAYVVDGTFHKMRSVSRVLHTELLNDSNQLIINQKHKITNGYSIGDFKIDPNLPQGRYLIRAYTNGMKNFDSQFLFHQYIDIFNSSSVDSLNSTKPNHNISEDIDLQFFPEGGSLIEGIQSRLAFKAINSEGKSIEVKGKIYRKDSSFITEFRTKHEGMGNIDFKAQKGEEYYALITSTKNNMKYPIPAPLKEGYILSIDNSTSNLQIRIQTNIPQNNIYIIGQSGGKVYYSEEIHMDSLSKAIKIPKSLFPSGITQFTLIDHKNRPFCERIVFIKNENDLLKISIESTKEIYAPREKVELRIKTTNINSIPQKANLSISITDFFQTNSKDSLCDNIYSYLLLSSELEENIENPGYYFKGNNKERLNHLDNLMLTQGWRRFSWQNALNDKKIPCDYAFEKGLVVNGKIEKCPKRYPVVENNLIIMFRSKELHTEILSPLPDSTFEFNIPDFTGTNRIFVNSLNRNGKPSLIKIKLDKPGVYNPSFDVNNSTQLQFSNSQKQIIKERNFVDNFYKDVNTVFLDEVSISAKKIKYHEKPDTYRDLAEGGRFIEDIRTSYSSALQYIAHLPGVTVSTNPNFRAADKGSIENYTRYIIKLQRTMASSFLLESNPLIVIDDVPYKGAYAVPTLESMNAEDLLYVNVLKGHEASFYGARANCGVIVIYTKNTGGTKDNENRVNYHKFNIDCFYSQRDYYSPSYDIPKKEHEKRDLRSSIYWNPNVKTDTNGNATITFFNSDRTTRIKTQVEGISNDGSIGFRDYFYEVSNKN